MGAAAARSDRQYRDHDHGVATAAHVEHAVFAAEELGWIAEEVQRVNDRAGGLIEAIGDPRNAIEPVRRMSEHPRLLRIAQRHLGPRVAVARCAVGAAPCDPSAGAGELVLVLPFRREAELAVGDVVVLDGGLPPPAVTGPALSIVYRADPWATTTPRSDDCLWPSPWVVAG